MIIRASLAWLLLLLIATIVGVLRTTFLEPRIGEQSAHILGTLVIVVVFVAIIWTLVPWIDPRLLPFRLASVGIGWMVATVAFEFTFGHFVVGHSWSHLFSDYNLAAGRIWVAVLAALLTMPWLTAVLRR